MLIDTKKCVACANCIPVCPMGAIYVDDKINRATIDQDECVECGTCSRMSGEHLNPTLVRGMRRLAKAFRVRFEPEPDVCPTSAFVVNDLEWPRIARRVFSDPLVEHKSTGIHGRGTEEVKTNDVAHRVGVGEVGYVIEFGRPRRRRSFSPYSDDDASIVEARHSFRREESDHPPDDRQGRRVISKKTC